MAIFEAALTHLKSAPPPGTPARMNRMNRVSTLTMTTDTSH
jgi:hypothetical protein